MCRGVIKVTAESASAAAGRICPALLSEPIPKLVTPTTPTDRLLMVFICLFGVWVQAAKATKPIKTDEIIL